MDCRRIQQRIRYRCRILPRVFRFYHLKRILKFGVFLLLFSQFISFCKRSSLDDGSVTIVRHCKDHYMAQQRKQDEPFKTTIPPKPRECLAVNNHWFPLCRSKFKEFKKEWNENCHGKKFKINASDPCSVLIYLSEIEPWCPRLPWRPHRKSSPPQYNPQIQSNIEGLLELLDDKDFAWLRMRAESSWSEWVSAARGMLEKENPEGRKRQRIVIYMGACEFYPTLLQNAFTGGYQGELVQWTDVICTLYILGHDLIITKNSTEIKEKNILTIPRHGCAAHDVRHVDHIITDITGIIFLKFILGPVYAAYRCKLLILDSFGTEAEFNYAEYKGKLTKGSNDFGKQNLNLQQFLTMYPHSPDNLFMGFAIPIKSKAARNTKKIKTKGVIYGKLPDYYEGKRGYLDTLHKYFELHGNIYGKKEEIKNYIPDYVTNHGIVNVSYYAGMLQDSKVFVGLGYPYEGPGPLDAIANGCFFINPKQIPPQGRRNSAFFAHKPTNREITSQNPYTEDFIGKPFVYTIDMNNNTEVENTIQEILASKAQPHLPYEFTHGGMLQRVDIYLRNLDFCKPGHQWPPVSTMKVLTSGQGKSCKDVCFNNGLLCEPAFFRHINNEKQLKRAGLNCKAYDKKESLYAPLFNSTDQTCILQDMPLLYSCVSRDEHVRRICPCRTYQKEQVAFYKN